jgi:hypothetical protein
MMGLVPPETLQEKYRDRWNHRRAVGTIALLSNPHAGGWALIFAITAFGGMFEKT